MMLSLSATYMLLVSVIAFSYANLFNILAFIQWIVNSTNTKYLNLAINI